MVFKQCLVIKTPTARPLKIGAIAKNEDITVELGDEELATHMAIYGGTGKGKSKLLELIIRQLFDRKSGACIIDPHGDLTEDHRWCSGRAARGDYGAKDAL